MKKIIQLLYILFAVAAFSACSDDNQGEVVSQDLSYQLDACQERWKTDYDNRRNRVHL